MKLLWGKIESLPLTSTAKYRLTRIIAVFACALAGLLVWGIAACIGGAAVGSRTLLTAQWIFVFAGYPAVIGWIVTVLYSWNHSFHEGALKN